MVQPIHDAAWEGNLAEVNRLIQEGGERLEARGGTFDRTPLMYAAWEGRDAVVARLLALGADVGLTDTDGNSAAHVACVEDNPSVLTLLFDAGASLNARTVKGSTPLMVAAFNGATACVTLLLARGGDALELDAQCLDDRRTALHRAARQQHPDIVRLLLLASADPTIPNIHGDTPLDLARRKNDVQSTLLLEAAVAEPQRARSLLKARVLLDTAHHVRQVQLSNDYHDHDDHDGQPRRMRTRGDTQRRAVASAPVYLKGRVAEGRALPAVEVAEGQGPQNEELAACLKYALGMEGGGGVHDGEGPPPQGMLREVLVELCEMLVPKRDRASV